MQKLSTIRLIPLPGIPEVQPGDDLARLIIVAMREAGEQLERGDVLVVAQKIVSKAEGRMVALAEVEPSARAREMAAVCAKDPRLVELVLDEAEKVVRLQKDVLIVRHRLGFTVANAAIDQSNVEGGDAHALLLPVDPHESASRLHLDLLDLADGVLGVVINDSFGRPWRFGTCGVAIGCAGVESLRDLRGQPDRFGRQLLTSELAIADEIAAAASLLMGQAAEGVPVVLVRGLAPFPSHRPASDLIRPPHTDLFR